MKKRLSKVTCEVNSVDINFSVDSGASVNIIDIHTFQKISKVCEIGFETTNSKIYTFDSNNSMNLNCTFNAIIKNSGSEVYTRFYVIYKLKKGNLLSKNASVKLQILLIKDENLDAINLKNLGNIRNIRTFLKV